MASVFETILEQIQDQNRYFVFPSEVAAALWARKICLHGGVRSVAADRFLAWDRFKEAVARAEVKSKRPASALVRRLFARALARKNAAAPFLSAMIPPDHAENGVVFAPFIAALLPALPRWEELQRKNNIRDDEEDRDLRIIKSEYTVFLEEYGLFEPSWEKVPFRSGEKRYLVFFPEVVDDYAEYRDALGSGAVVAFSAAETGAKKPELVFFHSARQEIRTAAAELRRLHEEGMPYEDMAVSLPDFKNIEPYVTRELVLRDIPFSLRAGKSLGEYPIGRIFSLIRDCGASGFSFDSLKSLLLNPGIPWKEKEKNLALITFGVDHHCVSPFRDRGRTADVWEEAFKQSPDKELAAYYRDLKRALSALTDSGSFKAIWENYFIFRSLLNIKNCGAENDAVLARCVEELALLAGTEAEFPDLAEPDPFGVYVSYLNDKNYVYDRHEGGVNIYDYPVAAGAPFGCHLVLNVSQDAATVQHRPLAFLRSDKRSRLGIEDADVSRPMLSLFAQRSWNNYVCHTRMSASEKTFAGWAIPHSFFALDLKEEEGDCSDPFAEEREWWASAGKDPAGEKPSGKKPERLFSVQRRGFEAWSGILPGRGAGPKTGTEFSAAVSALLRERIRSKNTRDPESPGAAVPAAELSVSATDLNEFFKCPVFWLYRRIFRLEPYREDAALLDDESKGLLYHQILYRLFARIQDKDRRFLKKNLDLYYEWIEEMTGAVLRNDRAFKNSLVYPLILPLTSAMNKQLRRLLKMEAAWFNGFEVAAVEQKYTVKQGFLKLTGQIDRVSLAPEGPVILDYKTNAAPSKNQSRKTGEAGIGLRDFQIPMYIKLYEAETGIPVNRAFFVIITKHDVVPIMGELRGKRDLWSRDDYQSTMEALEGGIGYFGAAVSALDFDPRHIPGGRGLPYKSCVSCGYKPVCRSLYALNPRDGADAGSLREKALSGEDDGEAHGF
jgi:hypothetical protein